MGRFVSRLCRPCGRDRRLAPLAAYDLLLWQTQRDAITSGAAWHDGNYTAQPGTRLVGEIASLIEISPEVFNESHTREAVPTVIADTAKAIAKFDANDHLRQSEAMTMHDVSARFGGSMGRASAAVKSRMLVIVSATERVVTPGPALSFARLIGADVLELHNNCGLARTCDREKINRAVVAFLQK